MGAYRLGKLRVKNYRSFEDDEVDFEPIGMSLIRGFNLDTGGSSYAGKSSLPIAVAVALGYCPFAVKDQQTWGVKSGLSVSQELIVDGKIWMVTRGAKTTLKPPEGETITGAAAVDARLKQLIGLDPEVLSALTYRKQESKGLFLFKTDAEKKEFLTTVLGLQAFERAVEDAGARATQADGRAANTQGRISQLEISLRSLSTHEPELADVSDMEARLVGLEADLAAGIHDLQKIEERVAWQESDLGTILSNVAAQWVGRIGDAQALVSQREKAVANVVVEVDTGAIDKLRGDLEEGRRRLDKLVEGERNARTGHEARCRQLDTEIATLRSAAAGYTRLDALAKELEAKILKAEASACPTCGQAWHQVQTQIDHWKRLRTDAVADMAAAFAAGVRADDLEAERAGLQFVPDTKVDRFRKIVEGLQAELAAEKARLGDQEELAGAVAHAELAVAQAGLRDAQAGLAAERDRVRAVVEAEVAGENNAARLLRHAVDAYKDRVYQAKLELKSAITENATRRNEYEARMKLRDDLENQVQMAQLQLNAEMAEANAERDFEEMIGYKGFLGVIFDEILAEITDETNTILGSVANTAHVTIHFSSEAVSQKGVARKEIRPVITIGGFPAPLDSGASGGMKTSINLAVDLAVANVISKRTNSWPGWLVLDESFEGLDQTSKETAMEMLSKHAVDRLILVVDHAAETKELFNSFIDVEFKNGRSKIRRSA